MERIICAKHMGQPLSNICCQRGCLAPLCPECIGAHLASHAEPPRIEALARMRIRCKELLSGVEKFLADELATYECAIFIDWEQSSARALEQLERFRQQLHAQLDASFADLREDFSSKARRAVHDLHAAPDPCVKLSALVEELRALRLNLEGPQAVESVKLCLRMDVCSLLARCEQQVGEALNRSLPVPGGFCFAEDAASLASKLIQSVTVETKETLAVVNAAQLAQLREKRDRRAIEQLLEHFERRE